MIPSTFKRQDLQKKFYVSQNLKDTLILHTMKTDKNVVTCNCKTLLIIRNIPIL